MFSLLYCYLDNRLCAVFLGYIKILFFKDMAALDHDLFICFLLSFSHPLEFSLVCVCNFFFYFSFLLFFSSI